MAAAVSLCACGSKSEKLLIAGTGWDRVAIIDRETKKIEWEHMLTEDQKCNSVAYLGDGLVMFAHNKGVEVVTLDHELVWKIDAPESAEMQTARVMADGNCLIAWNGFPLTIMEVEPKTGKILHKTEYDTGVKNMHPQTRQVNKMADGNYLIPIFATHDIRVVSPEGELLKSIVVGNNPFGSYLLDNGNYLIPCGDGHRIKEINIATGETVRTIGETDIEGIRLSFVAGLAATSRGTMYLCNWQGHDKTSTMPQIIEFDADNKVVWTLSDPETFGYIADICIIDKY